MNKTSGYCIELDDTAEKLLRKAEYLGCGHNGIVYLLPDNKVIKIFKERKICEKEYDILKRTVKSKYFPKTYQQGPYYIVRDYIGGERLDDYIKRKGLNRTICYNIIELIKEFKRLGFTKKDIRCKDLYVREDLSIRVIDPKNNYSKNCTYPRHLMKGLNKLGVLEKFLAVVNEEDSEVYKDWRFRMDRYLSTGIK